VRVKLLGIPVGVKNSGGILDQVLREVEIECLPADIPAHVDLDVSGLEMHGVLRVSDLPHTDKIKFSTPPIRPWRTLFPIREEAPTAAEAEAAAVAAATAATAAEPEVAKRARLSLKLEPRRTPAQGQRK